MNRVAQALILILFLSVFAHADIIVKYKSDAEITMKNRLKFDITLNIKIDRSYSTTTTNFGTIKDDPSGKSFNMISSNIVRLDKGIRWDVYSDTKTYDESPLTTLHTPDSTTNEYIWNTEVSPISDKREIKRYECIGQIAKAIGINNNNPADSAIIIWEQWSTEDTTIGLELSAYEENYAYVAQFHKIWAMEPNLTLLGKGYGTQFEKLANLMANIKSISIQSIITIERTLLDGKKPKDFNIVSKNDRWQLLHMTSEVESIKEKQLDNKLFEIPANYKKK